MVACFGEILLRLSPGKTWLENNSIPVYVGGAELNVATALGRWETPVRYITAMPDNYLTKEIELYIGNKGIETGCIYKSGSRIGLYFLQQGADLKNAGVIYDRANSSFSELKPGQIDWDAAMQGVDWFHFTAISPALSENAVTVCREALEYAAHKNITISVDLNYRAKLWQYGKTPSEVMPLLVQYCDVVMGNVWAAQTMLGIPVVDNIHDNPSMQAYQEHAIGTSEEIIRQFPKCKLVANTFRFDKNNGIRYFSSLYTNGKIYSSPEFTAETIRDKSGSGDCFMAGLIYGIKNNHIPQRTINFAAAAAFGKLQEKGDVTSNTIKDIELILQQHA